MGGEQPAARPGCEHYWASHCYGGLSVRLCQLCHEPDWESLCGQLEPSMPPEVERLTLRPGDRIVLRYPYHVPEVGKRAIAAAVRADLRLGEDTPVLVLDGGASVTVLAAGA